MQIALVYDMASDIHCWGISESPGFPIISRNGQIHPTHAEGQLQVNLVHVRGKDRTVAFMLPYCSVPNTTLEVQQNLGV